MSILDRFGMEKSIREVMQETTESMFEEHHFGNPFLTAYEIAVLFAEENSENFEAIGA